MKFNFCTLFDNNYLLQGLALHQSLVNHCPDFHLYILCFDEACKNNLDLLSLTSVTTITLSEFEDEQLLKVKPTRSRAEYCWTCSASVIRYCINTYQLDQCTYVDADVFFFNDPALLYKEMGDKEVAITSHNYDPVYDRSVSSGTFCIQYVTFFNKPRAIALLEQWRNQCLDWCYARYEEGKFGDQMYLEPWPQYDFVHVIQEKGAGMAPWNAKQFKSTGKDEFVFAKNEKASLLFYHFHGLKIFSGLSFIYTLDYYLPEQIKKTAYPPYISVLQQVWKKLVSSEGIVLPGLKPFPGKKLFSRARYIKIKSNITALGIMLLTKNRNKIRFDRHLFNSIHYRH